MRLGVVFPQTEIGSDPAVIRDYAQAAEGAGYDHLLVFDHVLGAKLERFDRLGRRPPYTDESSFHEPFVLFGYLAACTQRLELVTGIVILPQRQTALVAKQAAAVDVLTRRAPAPRRRHRLELRRVRGAERGLPHPRPARRRADRGHAQALDRAAGELQGHLSPPRPRRHQSAARPAPHPGMDRRHGRAGAQARGADLRRLVPAVPARRRGAADHSIACATTSRRRAARPRPSASRGGSPTPSADPPSGRAARVNGTTSAPPICLSTRWDLGSRRVSTSTQSSR